MRIAQILPGSGSRFYCENCGRDDTLRSALAVLGHEVVVGHLYLPSSPEPEQPVAPAPVFYGAVNLYLHHRFPALPRPRWAQRLLDSNGLLAIAGRLSGATDAAGLGDLTLSMLRGEEGGQAQELERLVRWLADVRPDVVHLSNCLLLGIARRVRRELDVPVACSLQDEHTWIDALSGPEQERAWAILRERAADVDLFLPVSAYYADFMGARLALPSARLVVVPIGIDVQGFDCAQAPPSGPPAIGFLSRVCEPMGAGILAEAFALLDSAGRLPGLRLRFAGGSTPQDRPFLRSLRRRLGRLGLLDRVDFAHSFARGERIRFLSSLSVLSVPVRGPEAFGTFVLEALAAGVPVVQPRQGGFPELVEATGGGALYEPNTPQALAAALEPLLLDRGRATRLGQAGREAVLAGWTATHMARRLEAALCRAHGGRRA